MTSGLTVLGVNNLGFQVEDTRTAVNEGELWVYKSSLGMVAERHRRKPSEDAMDGTDAKQDKTLKKNANAKYRDKATMFISCNGECCWDTCMWYQARYLYISENGLLYELLASSPSISSCNVFK
jgi:hypothetical protein